MKCNLLDHDVRSHPVLPNCDDSVSKQLLMEHGWRRRPQVEERLFDLIFDPNEARDVAGEPEYSEALAEMRGRPGAWMGDTDDPLLSGPVQPWPDSVANPIDGISPRDESGPARI